MAWEFLRDQFGRPVNIMDGATNSPFRAVLNRVFVARLALGCIFVFASIDKILKPAAFANIIHHYQILPDMFINAVSIVLPWLEPLLGLLPIFGLRLPGSVVLSNLLPAVFFGLLI
jgi:uncharacterized membrane protein YphA (DoxX/SURF4 family)